MIGIRDRHGLLGAMMGAALAIGRGLAQPASGQTGTAAKPFLDEANAAAAASRFVDALAAHTRAIAAAPEDPAVYAARARLLDRLGHPDLASGDYRIAVRLAPNDAGLQTSLCLDLALANHDLDRALVACSAAVGLAPENAGVLSARAYLQLRRGAYAEAEKDYSAVLALSPASPDDMFGFGLALIHTGRIKEGRGEIASATLDSSNLVSEWDIRGFGMEGEIRPSKPVTLASQPIMSIADRKIFLNKGETYVDLAGGCGMITSAGQSSAGASWSGECRFGLANGAGRLTSPASTNGRVAHFSYGREIVAGEVSVTAAQTLSLAYQAAEKAALP